MSVAPELPPQIQIPSAGQRRGRSAGRSRLSLVPPVARAASIEPKPAAAGAPVRRSAMAPRLRAASAPGSPGADRADGTVAAPTAQAPCAVEQLTESWVGVPVNRNRAALAGPKRQPRNRPVGTSKVVVGGALRLTARGRWVLAGLAVALAATLILFARLTAADAGADPSAALAHGPARIVVQSGDSLWSIARAHAPGADPRAVVTRLQRLNHLADATVQPGQSLRLR